MASSLEDLLNIKGVVAAGEFGLDGSLVDYQASVEFSNELAQTTAKFTAAVTQVFNVLAESFTRLNNQFNFAPQQGWAYSGGDWSVAVGGNRGVFVKTADADYNELFSDWWGPADDPFDRHPTQLRCRNGIQGDRPVDVSVLETSGLGDRSYLIHDGDIGVVVDPQRDIDRVLKLAADQGVRITHVWKPTFTATTSPGVSNSRARSKPNTSFRPANTCTTTDVAPCATATLSTLDRSAESDDHSESHPSPQQLRVARPHRRDRRGDSPVARCARQHRTH